MGPGGPRWAPGGQIGSQLSPIGSCVLDSWSSHTLTCYRAPSRPPGALKGPVSAQTPLLETLRFSEGLGGSDLVPLAPDWPAQVGLMVTTHFDLVSGPLWTTGGSKRACFGPNAPFEDLGGSRRALGDQIWSHWPPTGPPRLDSWSPQTLTWYQAPSGPLGALKEPVLAQTPLLKTLRFSEGLGGSDLVPDAPRLSCLGLTHGHHTLWPGIVSLRASRD